MLSDLSFVDQTIVWLNVFGFTAAGFVNWRAARMADPRVRWVHGAIVALAFVYGVAYVVLWKLGPAYLVQWSQILRGIAVVGVPVVWVLPAAMEIRARREDASKLHEVHAVLDTLQDREVDS